MTRATQLQPRQGSSRPRSAKLRDLHEDGEAPLATIGQELRNARLARGEDLASVSYALKIRSEHLDAIEDDRYDALPGRTYAVGFVRAYAEHVGLDPGDAVDRFKTEIAGRDQISSTAGFPEDIEEPQLSRGWFFIALIVVALIAYGVYYLFASGGTPPSPTVAALPPAMTTKTRALAVHPTNPPAPATGPQQPVIQGAGTVSPASPPQPGAGGQVYGKMNSNAHIVLRVSQPTRVLVQTEDGRAFINKELQPGDIYQVPNMRGLALTAEHGNAVEILVDGKPIGKAGKTAAAAEALPLDQDSAAKQRPKPAAPSQ